MLSDIDTLKQLNERLQKSKEFTEDIIDTVRQPLVVLARDLKVLYVNPSFLKAFNVSREDTDGKLLYRLGNEQWNIPKLRAVLEEVISKDTPLSDFEVEHDFPELGSKTMLLNARRIIDGHSDEAMMLLAIEDITERKQAEAALRESEERFRHLANTIPQLAWMADSTGAIFWYNQGWYEYTGTTPKEMEGWGWQSVHDPDELPKVLERWGESITTGKPFEMVFPLRGADGVFRSFLTRIAPMLDSDGKVVRWFGTNTDITEQRNIELALQEAKSNLETRVKERTSDLEIRNTEIVTQAKQLQELSVSLMRAQDDERRKISRELHDSLGQYLASAKMTFGALKRPGATEKETQSFTHLKDILEKCLTETRTISYLLHPPLLDEVGLSSASKWYVEGFSERSGIPVNITVPNELKRLPDAVEIALFRILQESLTNIHRHSRTPSVDIQLQLGSNEIALEVRDYGQGMPAEFLEGFRDGGVKGVGLRSMRERISELGGRFEIQSDKSGTLIRVTAPLSEPTKKSVVTVAKRSSQ